MSLIQASLNEVKRHTEYREKFDTILHESINDIAQKHIKGKEIKLSDLFELLPSRIADKVQKYQSIMD